MIGEQDDGNVEGIVKYQNRRQQSAWFFQQGHDSLACLGVLLVKYLLLVRAQ